MIKQREITELQSTQSMKRKFQNSPFVIRLYPNLFWNTGLSISRQICSAKML